MSRLPNLGFPPNPASPTHISADRYRRTDGPEGPRHALIGFLSLYLYYAFPEHVRPRIRWAWEYCASFSPPALTRW